jgi:Peptidase M61 N-terminal domain
MASIAPTPVLGHDEEIQSGWAIMGLEGLAAPLDNQGTTVDDRQQLGPIGLQYHVALPQPTSHLFEVTLRISGWPQAPVDLKMPVWTPGSYLVREYARHLQDFSAAQGDQPLTWQKPLAGGSATER